MRRILAVAAAAALLSCGPLLGACATGTPPAASNPATADERALAAAELAFRTSLLTVQGAVASGALQGQDAARARVALANARLALEAARAAYRLGDAAQTIAKAAEVGRLAPTVPAEEAPHGR